MKSQVEEGSKVQPPYQLLRKIACDPEPRSHEIEFYLNQESNKMMELKQMLD
jgi:hypothetical protein